MKHYKLDLYFEFTFCTQRFDTGAATDADALPTYRVYEENSDTVLLSGNCAKRDDSNTTGYYYVRDAVTAANGFEVGKTYEVRVAVTVNSVAGSAVVGRFDVMQATAYDALYGSGYMPSDLQTIKTRSVTDPGASVAVGTNVAQVGSNMGTVASVTGSVGSVTGSVAGSVGSVASYGTLVADIATAVWAAGTRTLSSFGTLAADVWAATTRVLTAGTNIALAKGVGVTGFTDLSQTDVRSAMTAQGYTDTRAGYLDTLNGLVTAVWASATRTLTAISDSSGITTLVSRLTSDRASKLDNLDTTVSSRSTYAGGAVASVTGAVGSVAEGGITSSSFGTNALSEIAASVWSSVTRTLTASDANIALLVARLTAERAANLDNLDTASSDIASALATILGLLGKSVGFRNATYDGSDLLTYDLCIYDTSAHAATNDGSTGLVAKFSVVNTYDASNNLLTSITTQAV